MKQSRFKNFLFGCITFLGTFLLLYLLGEGLVYWRHGKEMALFPRYVTKKQYNDYLIRGNVPGVRYWHKSPDGRWQFQINRQGFRSRVDYVYEKPPGLLRILVLGDSFTVGYEVGQDETYAAVLERELARQGITAEVINAGVSGFSNAEALIFLEQEGVRYQPDVVVLGFYANDLEDNIRTGLFKIDGRKLVANSKQYVPVTGIRDFLNSFSLYRWFSENSYLHNYLNATATIWVKGRLHRKRREEIAQLTVQGKTSPDMEEYSKQLACHLVGQIHRVASEHKAVFILLEIPKLDYNRASSSWPAQTCSPASVSDFYVDGLELLNRQAFGKQWYRPHGHHHWTPVSHVVAGKYLARQIAASLGKRPESFARKPQN